MSAPKKFPAGTDTPDAMVGSAGLRSRASLAHGIDAAIRAGLCACLVGVGLGRFAYTPLLPAVIAGGWFAPDQAAYLGAANFAGYLSGAMGGGWLAQRISLAVLLRAMMVLAALSFIACAILLPPGLRFAWFAVWRFAAGVAGGIIMVLAAPAILPLVERARRGAAGGRIFTGVGLGIAVSGTLVPILLLSGLQTSWAGIGLLMLAVTALAWRGLPTRMPETVLVISGAAPRDAPHEPTMLNLAPPDRRGVAALLLQYGLCAVGLVPHMVFLADFVARALGLGVRTGSALWIVFGVGAMAGPIVSGWAADRLGFRRAWQIGLAGMAGGILLPAVSHNLVALVASALVVGAMTPGCSALVLGRLHELEHDPGRQRAGWVAATLVFAAAQTFAAYGAPLLMRHLASGYDTLFLVAFACLVAAFAIGLRPAHRQ